MRTVPRPKIVRCITIARPIPRTSSMATEITVMTNVTMNAFHQYGEDSTAA